MSCGQLSVNNLCGAKPATNGDLGGDCSKNESGGRDRQE